MAGNIKGITIEFNGDTTKLDSALRDINKNTRALDKELRNVNNALKFNPTSVELWRQKQQILTEKVEETKKKLDVLKQAQQKMDAQGIDKTSEEYRSLSRQIIETESKVKNFETQLKKIGNVNLRAASEQFKEYGNQLTAAGTAMMGVSKAAAAADAAIAALTVKSAKWADDINTMSKVYGISTDELQKYSAAANLVDVSVETIAGSQRKLTKSLTSAKDGTGATAEAFKTLGVEYLAANGQFRDSDAIWQDVIKALGDVENETERDALAMQLLGRSAQDLNPLIEDGGETYKRVAETLQKYNLDFISEEDLANANKFNDELDTIKAIGLVAFQNLGTQLAGYLAPALEKVVGWVGKFAEWLGNLDPRVVTIIAAIGGVVAVVGPLLLILGKVAFAISSIMSLMSTIGPAIAALSGPVGIAIAAIAAIIAIGVALYKNWDTIKEKLRVLKDFIVKAWDAVKNALKVAAQAIFDYMTWPYRKAWEFIKAAIDKIKSFFPIKIKDFFGKIKLPHFKIKGEFSLNPLSVPTIGIDWYDKGGIFTHPSIIGVGEKRPEFVGALDDLREIVREETGGGGEITINVYPSAGMDENALALKIEQRLVQLQKQRAAAYGTI